MTNQIYKHLTTVKQHLRWSKSKYINANINGTMVLVTLETSFDDIIVKVI